MTVRFDQLIIFWFEQFISKNANSAFDASYLVEGNSFVHYVDSFRYKKGFHLL